MSDEMYNQDTTNCKGPMTVFDIRRALLLAVRAHFSVAGSSGSAHSKVLGCLKWDPSGGLGGLEVDLMHSSVPKQKKNTDRVYVALSEGLVLEDKGTESYGGEYPKTTGREHTMRAASPLRVAHVSKSPDISMALAESTMDYLIGTQRWFMRLFPAVKDVQVAGLTPLTLFQEDGSDTYRTDVKGNIIYDLSIIEHEESHLIKVVDFVRIGFIGGE